MAGVASLSLNASNREHGFTAYCNKIATEDASEQSFNGESKFSRTGKHDFFMNVVLKKLCLLYTSDAADE